jgi:hypothetical protein
MELGVSDPVPTLNTPAISYQLHQGFWGGAQAREKQMSGTEGLAVTGTGGRQLNYPAGAAPGFTDVRWCLFCSQRPGDAAAVADLVIACHEWDVTLSLKLAADLAMQRLLVAFYRQQEVGSLLLELVKNGFWVWCASAWISTPPRSNSPSNRLSTARSWFSPVA